MRLDAARGVVGGWPGRRCGLNAKILVPHGVALPKLAQALGSVPKWCSWMLPTDDVLHVRDSYQRAGVLSLEREMHTAWPGGQCGRFVVRHVRVSDALGVRRLLAGGVSIELHGHRYQR